MSSIMKKRMWLVISVGIMAVLIWLVSYMKFIPISNVTILGVVTTENAVCIELEINNSIGFKYKGYETHSLDNEEGVLITAYEKLALHDSHKGTELINVDANGLKKVYYGTLDDYECIWEVENG